MRLTLRTLLAYLDDTLPPAEAAEIGRKLAKTPDARALAERIKAVSRRRGITPPDADPNRTADYLSDALPGDAVADFESECLADDGALAEVAACHQVLTLVLSEQVKVPPTARSRMYGLVKGRESVPGRKPAPNLSVAPVREADPAEDAEADAQLLLGLPAYSSTESGGLRAARFGALAALAAGVGLCVWMAWPKGEAVAVAPAEVKNAPAVVVPPPAALAATPPTAATVPPPVVPAPAAEPAKPEPPPPPKADRLALGQLDRPAGGAPTLLARRPVGGDAWERVGPDAGGVMASDRLVSLPGFRSPVRLDSGATLDLWGNLPELSGVGGVHAAAVTPAATADGFHADLTVHTGRVYLGSKQPGGVKVRLRFLGQVWDVALPDDKAEVVFQLVPLPTPGEAAGGAAATAQLVTLAGPATVTPAGGAAVKLERYAGLGWTTAAGATPQPLPPLGVAERAPLAKLYTSPPNAQPLLTVLADLAKRAGEGGSVTALLDELVQAVPENQASAPRVFAGTKVGLAGLAALGRGDKLADLLATPANPVARRDAALMLLPVLAADPEQAAAVRKVLVEQKNLSQTEADEALRLMRGLAPAERTDPATVDRLLTDLTSSALPLRELALLNLIALTPPEDQAKVFAPPFFYDLAGSDAEREKGQRAWKQRGEDMKKKLAAKG